MSWEFFDSRPAKAGTPHRCVECRGAIAVGEAHTYCAGKVEGEFTSYRLCAACALIVAEASLAELLPFEGWGVGELRADLRDEHGIADALTWAAARQNARLAAIAARMDQAQAALAYQGGGV